MAIKGSGDGHKGDLEMTMSHSRMKREGNLITFLQGKDTFS